MIKNDKSNVEKCYPKGTRIELESMSGESRMPSGLQGTVSYIDDAGQIHMNWDNGSTLALIVGEDSFRKLTPEQSPSEEQAGGMTMT